MVTIEEFYYRVCHATGRIPVENPGDQEFASLLKEIQSNHHAVRRFKEARAVIRDVLDIERHPEKPPVRRRKRKAQGDAGNQEGAGSDS